MSWEVRQGDCIEQMRQMDEASVDAVVTDPPYGLEFMGKEWDRLGAGTETAAEATDRSHPFRDGSQRVRYGATVKAMQEWHHAWATEALRILKPGGHLLAFGGTRTYHRLACAVEDAGFEIRDSLIWLYGSGFPKSLDVSKAIDKAAGVEREVVGKGVTGVSFADPGERGFGSGTMETDITAPATPEAQRWQGWGTALKPGHEPIVVARKPLSGTVAGNVLEHGTGALNVDGCRVGLVDGVDDSQVRTMNRSEKENDGWGMNTTGADEPQVVKPEGRWPANVVLDEQAAAELDAQSGERPGMASQHDLQTTESAYFGADKHPGYREGFNDSGGASRFFYCAKASRAERNAGLKGEPGAVHRYGAGIGEGNAPEAPSIERNVHPTVKPISLMRWLCRLVTPPEGTVLDPFVGSGTTGAAAMLESFNFIGIEREAEYVEIAKARIEWWEQHQGREADEVLAASATSERERAEYEAAGQLGLLEDAA